MYCERARTQPVTPWLQTPLLQLDLQSETLAIGTGMTTERTSENRFRNTVTGLTRHMLGFVFAITLGVADASAAEPAPAQRSLQDTAWVLYEINDAHGKAIAPFAASADGNRTIVPVLFRTDYLELSTGCRRLVAPYRQQGARLMIAQAYASQNACPRDNALAPLIERLRGEFVVSFAPIAGTSTPALHLKAPSGEDFVLYDNGALRFTDPDDVLPQPLVLYLQIGPDTMGCGYNGPYIPGWPENVCIAARLTQQGTDGVWRANSAPYPVMPEIRGLDAPAGSRSIVRVLRYEIAYPDIHASRYRDVLDMVIEQELPESSSADYQNPSHHWIP